MSLFSGIWGRRFVRGRAQLGSAFEYIRPDERDGLLADEHAEIATDLVDLYCALGGGWEIADLAYGANRASQ